MISGNEPKKIKYTHSYKLYMTKNKNKYLDFAKSIIHKTKNIKINNNGEIYRAVGNAVHHGKLPLKCKIYIHKENKQVQITIKDNGNGFNYKETINKFRNGEVWYHYHGKGMKTYDENKHLLVEWNKLGKKIWLTYGLHGLH